MRAALDGRAALPRLPRRGRRAARGVDGVARVRMQGSCRAVPASAMTLKLAIEDAVLKAAPDVEQVEAAGRRRCPAAPAGRAAAADRDGARRRCRRVWATAGALAAALGRRERCSRRSPASRSCSCASRTGRRTPTGRSVPGCGGSLEDGPLESAGLVGAELTCPRCGNRYDVVRAGRCLDAPELHLEPVPLLVDEAGLVRVAVQAAAV